MSNRAEIIENLEGTLKQPNLDKILKRQLKKKLDFLKNEKTVNKDYDGL